MSSEHDVSLMSGKSILEKIDKNKYETTIIYIKKNGKIYEYTGKNEEILQAKTEELIEEEEGIISANLNLEAQAQFRKELPVLEQVKY